MSEEKKEDKQKGSMRSGFSYGMQMGMFGVMGSKVLKVLMFVIGVVFIVLLLSRQIIASVLWVVLMCIVTAAYIGKKMRRMGIGP